MRLTLVPTSLLASALLAGCSMAQGDADPVSVAPATSAQPVARRRTVCHRFLTCSLRQSPIRHSGINCFVLSGRNQIGLVPNANVAPAVFDRLVKGHPGRPVGFVAIAGIGLKMLKAAPVLGHTAKTKILDFFCTCSRAAVTSIRVGFSETQC